MLTSSVSEGVATLDREVPGNFKFSELGATKEEVSIKKISNKKMMSVSEDILNSALILLLFLSPMVLDIGCD